MGAYLIIEPEMYKENTRDFLEDKWDDVLQPVFGTNVTYNDEKNMFEIS